MSEQSPRSPHDSVGVSAVLGGPVPRRRSDRLGNAVVRDLAALITTRQVEPGELLPTESQLSEHYDVSRTVIRESVKRLEEKGLLRPIQGRGTIVEDRTSWNVLDPIVLSVLIEHDATIGILDDFSAMRAALEGMMAASMAKHADADDVEALRVTLDRMRESDDDAEAFGRADADFHGVVMSRAGNYLAENVTHSLFAGALGSPRFVRNQTSSAFEITLDEHAAILDAIADEDPKRAEATMRSHITESWARRRPRDVDDRRRSTEP